MTVQLNTQAGAALRGIREDLGVTTDELAKAMRLSPDSLRRIERGAANLAFPHVDLAAERLGKTPSGLLSALAREVESMARAPKATS